jgi:hypothetical protein
MPKQDDETVEAAPVQSGRATFDKLFAKPRAEQEVAFKIPVSGGGEEEVTFLFRAIGTEEYDKVLGQHPPNVEQRAAGDSFNIHTFAPALLAKVCVDPAMSEKEWRNIWNSPSWSRGESSQFFMIAVSLCNRGLEAVPLSGSGFATTAPST